MAGLVDLVGVSLYIGGDLGLRRRREHLPRAVTNDLVEQRRTGRVLVGPLGVVDYLEHGRTFRTSAPTLVTIRATGFQIILGKVRSFAFTWPRAIHRF